MANGDLAMAENEVIAGFQAMLEELKVNSRPHLTTLTILAGEFRQYASQIVSLIETRLNRVRRYRLPIMYLIDNIIKEFPEEYVPIFSNNLVSFFAETFSNANLEERTKLYELRTTWDDVFQPKVLYKLDVKIKQIDSNWPVRVMRNGMRRAAENGNRSSSDEFSSSDSEPESRPHTGTTGVPVSNGRSFSDITPQPTPMSSSKTPRTPHSSVHSSPRTNDPFVHQHKSRPSSIITSPMLTGEHAEQRPHRYRSLDERVSSLEAESRQQTDISDVSDDETKLEIVENVPAAVSPASSKVERSMPVGRLKHSRFESPKSAARRGSGNSSTVSSPRNRDSSGFSVVSSSGRQRAERGIQVKASSTTRAIQTGQFTRECSTETTVVERKEQATQKNRRKPKQCHFSHQFNGNRGRVSTGTQVERTTTTTSSQWHDHDVKNVSPAANRLCKGFEFRNCVTRYCENGSARMADSILRRLHDQQKRSQFCDLTINCDGKQFRVHKGVVAAVSEIIEREAWMSDEVTLKDIQHDVMEKLIDYCYTQMLGPFTSRKEVEQLIGGIRKMKIRSLDFVTSRVYDGLLKDSDYIGYAISGTELISAEIVTAAMIGHSLPPEPSSSYGLVDLEETGLNGAALIPDQISDEELAALAAAVVVPESPKTEEIKAKIHINTDPPKMIDEEVVKRMPHKKRIVAMAKRDHVPESSSSSSESTTSTTSSESEENNTTRLKPGVSGRRVKRSFGKQLTNPKNSPKIGNVPKKRKAAAEVSQKKPVADSPKDTASTPKRQRRRTNEGVGGSASRANLPAIPEAKNSTKPERRGRPRKIIPLSPTAQKSPPKEKSKPVVKDLSPVKSVSPVNSRTPVPPRSTRGRRPSPAQQKKATTTPNSSPPPPSPPLVIKTAPIDTLQQILDDEKAEDFLAERNESPSPIRTHSPAAQPPTPTRPMPNGAEPDELEKPEPLAAGSINSPRKSPIVRVNRIKRLSEVKHSEPMTIESRIDDNQEPDVDKENDQDEENDKRRTRRRTIATKTDLKKEQKKETKPKTPRRKSIGVLISPIASEPYSQEVSDNLRLVGEDFVAATGFQLKVKYLQYVIEENSKS